MRSGFTLTRLLIDAGRSSGVRPADIVGAIANEADIPGRSIGAIDIHDSFSMVDIPAQYLHQILERMQGATIRSQDTNIRVTTPNENPPFAEKECFKPPLNFYSRLRLAIFNTRSA